MSYTLEAKQPGPAVLFPWKLHQLLEDAEKNGRSHIISWLPSDKAFKLHLKTEFCREIMPFFFNSSKFKTFQRSLNLWGFARIDVGPHKGAYYNPFFVRGKPYLCHSMKRVKIKGNNEVTGKFNGAVSKAAPTELSPAIPAAATEAARPVDDISSTSRLLHVRDKANLLPKVLPVLPVATEHRSNAVSVSDFIRSNAAAKMGAGPTSVGVDLQKARLREAQIICRLRRRIIEAAHAQVSSSWVAALSQPLPPPSVLSTRFPSASQTRFGYSQLGFPPYGTDQSYEAASGQVNMANNGKYKPAAFH